MFRCLVAVERNSPNVQDAPRGRERRSVIGGEAKRCVVGRGGVAVGAGPSDACNGPLGCMALLLGSLEGAAWAFRATGLGWWPNSGEGSSPGLLRPWWGDASRTRAEAQASAEPGAGPYNGVPGDDVHA